MNNSSIHQDPLDVISRQTENHQQIKQSPYILKPNQKVYLYIDLIQPPKSRKLPIKYYPKQPKQPFPITRDDLLVQRELASFRY